MLRTLIAAILLAALLIAAHANGAPGEPGPLEVSQAGTAKAQECRTVATASTTKTTSPGFTAETSTSCRYDKSHQQVDLHQQIQRQLQNTNDDGLDHHLRQT